MLRSAASKVMWVGRATVFLLGLAVILALLFGVASTALGKNGQALILGKGKNVATKVTGLVGKVASGSALVVKNPKGGSALGLEVNAGKAPLTVNADAGKAKNLDADKLDGFDSDHMLPLVRAQKDVNLDFAEVQSGNTATANTVSITTPTEGFLIISGSMHLKNNSTVEQSFALKPRLDGTDTVGRVQTTVLPGGGHETIGFDVTVPVSPGEHTVTSELERMSGSGNWVFNGHTLNVMFVHADRGAVTDTDTEY